ncbi:serine/threonine-protein kinase HipA [Gammaproteobacteria bacterium]
MLKVHAGDTFSGELFRGKAIDRKSYIFGYGETCPPAGAVSLTMPVMRDQYAYPEVLHPIFDMNLPEGVLADQIRRQFRKAVERFDDLDFLQIVGQSQIGRLRFAAPDAPATDVPAQSLKEILVQDGAAGLFDDLMARYAVHSGISGVQPKVMIRDDEAAVDRVTHRGATHIVKAWNPDTYPNLAENEFFCMTAAQRAEIDVADFQLSNHGKFLVIDRFDRVDDRYLGFEDFCVLNGLPAEEKYSGSYENVAKRIRQFVSPHEVRPALEQFFKSLALSCAVQNGDAHLKNFGVVYDNPEGRVKLAKAYDIVSTTPYLPADSLALTLGGSKRFPKAKVLLAFGRTHCGFSDSRGRKLLDEVAEGIIRTTNDIWVQMRERPEFAEVGGKMLKAWNDGINCSLRFEDTPLALWSP